METRQHTGATGVDEADYSVRNRPSHHSGTGPGTTRKGKAMSQTKAGSKWRVTTAVVRATTAAAAAVALVASVGAPLKWY
jgi:hypothetical protein